MFIAFDLLNAHPTKENSASRAYHFIAAINLLNGELTTRALLGTLGDIEEIQLLMYLVYSLLSLIFESLFEFIKVCSFNLKSWALFAEVVLLSAS